MELTLAFGIVAGLIRIFTGQIYVRDVYAGHNHPQRSGWLIFLTLNFIFLSTQWVEGARYSIISLTIGTFFILLVIPKLKTQGVGGFDLKDKISLSVAIFGLFIWAITNEPLIALWMSLLVDAAGAWLVIEKTYRLPWSETKIAWLGTTLTGTLSLLAVGSIDYELLIVPGYLTLVSIIMNYVIWSRRKVIAKPY